jgi:hypothetical protein
MSNDKAKLPDTRITMSEPSQDKPSQGGSGGEGFFFKAVWLILAPFALYGVLGVMGVNIYQDTQFIRAYPDQADRTYRETGKRPE